MEQVSLVINLTKSFVFVNLYSYDSKGYINCQGSFSFRLPQGFCEDEVSLLVDAIIKHLDDEFLVEYKLGISDIENIYVFSSKGSNRLLKTTLDQSYKKIDFASAMKHSNIRALMISSKLHDLMLLVYDDSGCKLMHFSLDSADLLTVKVDKILDDYMMLFTESEVNKELKNIWSEVEKFSDDFDLFLNSSEIGHFGISKDNDLFKTKFLFDTHVYKNIPANDLQALSVGCPLILTGGRFCLNGNTNYILYSLLTGINKSGMFDIYIDKSNSIFNLLSIDFNKGALPSESFLEKNTDKYLNLSLSDAKSKYKSGDALGTINFNGEKELNPYKGSIWSVLLDYKKQNEIRLRLQKGITLGKLKDKEILLKNINYYDGIVVNTGASIEDELKKQSESDNNVLKHFE